MDLLLFSDLLLSCDLLQGSEVTLHCDLAEASDLPDLLLSIDSLDGSRLCWLLAFLSAKSPGEHLGTLQSLGSLDGSLLHFVLLLHAEFSGVKVTNLTLSCDSLETCRPLFFFDSLRFFFVGAGSSGKHLGPDITLSDESLEHSRVGFVLDFFLFFLDSLDDSLLDCFFDFLLFFGGGTSSSKDIPFILKWTKNLSITVNMSALPRNSALVYDDKRGMRRTEANTFIMQSGFGVFLPDNRYKVDKC